MCVGYLSRHWNGESGQSFTVSPMALALRLKWLSFTPLPRMAREITTLR